MASDVQHLCHFISIPARKSLSFLALTFNHAETFLKKHFIIMLKILKRSEAGEEKNYIKAGRLISTQQTFAHSKSTKETLEKDVNMFQFTNKIIITIWTTSTGIFMVYFQHTSQLFLMFLLLTLRMYLLAGYHINFINRFFIRKSNQPINIAPIMQSEKYQIPWQLLKPTVHKS